MKKKKMIETVKRLPTEGLYDFFEVLVNEINIRKNAYKKEEYNARHAELVSASQPEEEQCGS